MKFQCEPQQARGLVKEKIARNLLGFEKLEASSNSDIIQEGERLIA